MITAILVPLDGSRFGEEAIPYALEIARRSKAKLHLVHVHVPPSFGRYPDLYVDKDHQIRTDEEIYLHETALRLEKTELFKATTALVVGSPVIAIHERAKAVKANLVVMTTHGRGPLSRLWLGSVADGLVRNLPAPTLLVRPNQNPKADAHWPTFRELLIPLDGSAESEVILKPALELGRLMGCTYTLFQSIPPVPLMGFDITGVPAGAIDLQLVEQLQESARTYLNNLAGPLRSEGLSVRTVVVVHPSAATAILDQALAIPNTAIALTTAGRSGLTRFILGSVADKVIRGATVPVLVHRANGSPT